MTSGSAPTSWEEYAQALGERLRDRRRGVELTQEDLAHRAGLTRTHYQQLERGLWKPGAPSNPSIKTLVRLSQELQVGVADLLPPGGEVSFVTEV